MLRNTQIEYCDHVTCGVDHDVDPDSCRIGYKTSVWREDFVVRPLKTAEQRKSYRKYEPFVTKSMGRGEAAAVFETVALGADQIQKWLCIADATERLALNSPCENYMNLVIEGFDEPEITGERALYVLLEVSRCGSWGGWPSHDESLREQFLRDVGAAIRTMIDPAWSSDLRARLEQFRLNREEDLAEWRARR